VRIEVLKAAFCFDCKQLHDLWCLDPACFQVIYVFRYLIEFSVITVKKTIVN
jgi:hypothetical protein